MLEADAQSQRALNGRVFVEVVTAIVSRGLGGTPLTLVPIVYEKVRNELGSAAAAQRVMAQLTVTRSLPCSGRGAPLVPKGLALIDRQAARAVALLDCTTSLHSRQTESCFWARELGERLHYALVFQDREVHTHKRSELGVSCAQASSARRMLEAYVGGIYLLKLYPSAQCSQLDDDLKRFAARGTLDAEPCFDNPSLPGHTTYCPQVLPLDTLLHRAVNAAWPERAGEGQG